MTGACEALVIVGAGGFGREVADFAAAAGIRLDGFLDDGSPDLALLEMAGAPLLGTTELLADGDVTYVIAIGSGSPRRTIDERATAAGATPAVVVDPRAAFGRGSDAAAGLIVCANATVTANVRFGRHCQVHFNATVGHDSRLGDYVSVFPGANISGNVTLGDGVTIGAGAVVLQGLRIGAGTTIGAGAVVTTDLPAGVTAVGVPAAPLRR